MSEAAERGRVAMWASGLCAAGASTAALAAPPRNRTGFNARLADGVALGMFETLAGYLPAACAGC